MRLFINLIIFASFVFLHGCAGGYEKTIKRYEDYFPSNTDISKSEQSINEEEVSEKGLQYSDDGYFNDEPKELKDYKDNSNENKKVKCKAVQAPGPKKIGNPYKINGITYYPMSSADGYSEEGIASWYGPGFHGKLTANGEVYNQRAMTAAHKTLPLPTLVKVDNLENGKSVIVRVNDRGPYSKGRIIDLTEVAAERLGMLKKGTARVRVSVLSEDPDCYVSNGKEVDISDGEFAVQIGAFSVVDNAERLADKFGRRGVVVKGYVNGLEVNRVLVRGYKSYEKAREDIETGIGLEYPGSFVVRYK